MWPPGTGSGGENRTPLGAEPVEKRGSERNNLKEQRKVGAKFQFPLENVYFQSLPRLSWDLNLEELCETEIRDKNNLQNRDGLQEVSAGSDGVLSDDSGGTIRSVRKDALWPLSYPVSRTGSPGSMLHIWPSHLLRTGTMKCLSVPGPRPLSHPHRLHPVLFPLSHRCSQCHPTETPKDKAVFCVRQWRKSRRESEGTPWESIGWL